MHITICGGGNAAHTLAGLLGSQDDLTVNVYAAFGDEAERWRQGIEKSGGIKVLTPEGSRVGRPRLISSQADQVFRGSKLVLLALPAFAHEPTLRQIAPYLEPGAWVGVLPARGGFDLCARDVLKDRTSSITLFGFQTLPWACRIQEYGQQVQVLGAKHQVDVAVSPPQRALVVTSQLQEMLGVHLNPIPSFLSLTLADTGQLIHPGIMYGLFHDWDGQPFDMPPLFYQGVNDAIASTLQQMSDEVQVLRNALEARYPALDLSAVRPLKEWLLRSYPDSIADSSTLQSSFATNRSYAGLLAPSLPTAGGFIPDFQARYLAEDVPYDLLVTRGIAELAGVNTPVIDRVISWAQSRLEKEYLVSGKLQGSSLLTTRAPQRYGITSLDKLMLKMHYLPSGETYPEPGS